MGSLPNCGCWYLPPVTEGYSKRRFLPQVDIRAHATVLSATARTTLTQTFVNPTSADIEDAQYIFPLYDGVSVVSFRCEVGGRVIHGVVKERQKARQDYDEAVKAGKKAALLEQSLSASDTFMTSIGKVPAKDKAVVYLTYLGELKHDAQADGIRFSIPSVIAPRYGQVEPMEESSLPDHLTTIVNRGKAEVTVDVEMPRESKIQALQSPSHPVNMTLGRTSAAGEDVFEANFASATFSSQDLHFGKDFILIVRATGQDQPTALLETHPDLPDHRAVMASLVPKFNIPAGSPEIVFIIDRSGSMDDKISTLQSALRVFLKSLPVGVKFNICSFGSNYEFMWSKSQTYDEKTLKKALKYVDKISSNMGGTEMLAPVKATVENRFKDMETEILLLTDGQIWDQRGLFDFINESVTQNPIRFFSLGIGDAASHSLIEGIARAGDGFAQSVGTNEELDKKVVRMLKGALTPHVKDYTLEIEYDGSDDDEYEIVEKSNDIPLSIRSKSTATTAVEKEPANKDDKMDVDQKKPISLVDPNYKEADIDKNNKAAGGSADLPELTPPKILQAPYKIPALYSFNRTTVYMVLSPGTNPRPPKSVTLRGVSRHGPLQLTVPIEDVGKKRSIHQLAARKLMVELEEGRGWVFHAKDTEGNTVVEAQESKKDDLVKREAVRLGTKFQVGGKWCSFVAVEEGEGQTVGEKGGEAELEKTRDARFADAEFCATPASSTFGGGENLRIASIWDTYDPTISDYDPTIEDSYNPTIKYVCDRGQRLDSLQTNTDSLRMAGMLSAPGGSGKPRARKAALFGGFGSARSSSSSSLFGSLKNKVTGPFHAKAARRAAPPTTTTTTTEEQKTSQGQAAEKQSTDEESDGGGPSKAGGSEEDPVHAIIAQQAFEGSWEWTSKILQTLGITDNDLADKPDWAKVLGVGGDTLKKTDGATRRIMVTLAVVAYLRVKQSSHKETWELVADKAMTWVEGHVGPVVGGTKLSGALDERMAPVEELFK